MAEQNRKSSKLLPNYFQTEKNNKFLSSTLDQLINEPKLERINGFIGSKISRNFDATTDRYIPDVSRDRTNYQFEPATVFRDSSGQVNDIVTYDDLINAIKNRNIDTTHLDNLLRSDFYSYDPYIDWDKLINFDQYYWLINGPVSIIIDDNINVDIDIIGKTTYLLPNNVDISNGMKLKFSNKVFPINYREKEYVVEGVGDQIKLIEWNSLEVYEPFAKTYDELFDQEGFDEFPFDGSKKLPIDPEYITINRASKDRNPWSRYNRWFHKNVILQSAAANGDIGTLPNNSLRAKRPIVEFRPNIKLNNFGAIGTDNVALIDTDTEDVFNTVENSLGYYVDGVNLEKGQRVVFNADRDENVRSKIYKVDQVLVDGLLRLKLTEVENIVDSVAIAINFGMTNAGTSWRFNSSTNKWILAQQHTILNEGPLFDLFDTDGESYSDKEFTNFSGNKLFGYELGTQFDSVLGINVKTDNISGIGSYIFKNYFMTEKINFSQNNTTIEVLTADTFFKVDDTLKNVWSEPVEYQLPIIEIQTTEQTTSTLILKSIDVPIDLTGFSVNAYDSQTNEKFEIITSATTQLITVDFTEDLQVNQTVIFKINSKKPPNENGYWEIPKGLTNNPLNGSINSFTLSVLTDHLFSMAERIPNFEGKIQGENNLRDLVDYGKYGSRLIINSNPIAFSNIFLGKQEHDVISALEWGYKQYDSFKLAFFTALDNVDSQLSPRDAVDTILLELTKNKDDRSAFFYSDMLGYGTDRITKEFRITNPNITEYPIGTNFDLSVNSYEAVYIYKNNQQLVSEIDYQFNPIDGTVIFLTNLSVNDNILIDHYSSTKGCFVPPTPTKLALLPHINPAIISNFGPDMNVDMILEHDGSYIKSYGDYRDDIILEYELRIHNNLKVFYDYKIFDNGGTVSGYFKETHINDNVYLDIFREYLLEWAGKYNIDLYTNSNFDIDDYKTWNYKNCIDAFGKIVAGGSYIKLLRWYFGTDAPQFRPWQMLGFLGKPSWWDNEYGEAPWTSGNTKLWTDLELGYIRGENRFAIDRKRPGLSQIIPVDEYGILKPVNEFLVNDNGERDKQADWTVGDVGPAEDAFRRSSIFPFVRIIGAILHDPITSLARTFDCGRTYINDLDQIVYGSNIYLNPKNLILDRSQQPLIGYGSLILERGFSKDQNYQAKLQQDLTYIDFNLVYKVGGFVNKDKLQIIVDSVDPTSLGIGNILPQEDYDVIFQTSNPVDTFSCSGIIVQKANGKYQVKGYDNIRPWFDIFEPYTSLNAQTLTIGGKPESFTDWLDITNNSNPDLSGVDLTTAISVTGRFYKQGQIVRYNNNFYRVKTSHNSTSSFDTSLFQLLPNLPVKGGITVEIPSRFSNKIRQIPYGTSFDNIQQVYNFILGYGEYLKSVGFIFDKFANEFGEILDWKFSAKEFLFWSTQNWEEGHIITLSPFAQELKFQHNFAVVDNVISDYDNFNLLQADGRILTKGNFSITRDEKLCTITSKNDYEGIFFAKLRLVQKEHALVFNNTTIFNDTIYDIETGFKQSRAKLNGFRTLDWNGDFFSPGFVFDNVKIKDWISNVTYLPSEIVRFNGEYYSANKKITPESSFDFTKWTKLPEKPKSELLPNFEYKINQFEDFYSLDIDNFDFNQQILAQKLIGFTERSYLKDIFPDSISQYKFYQGYIREKGTLNAITKLNKASKYNLKGDITVNEEWAFRIGNYGGYSSYDEIEFTLRENTQIDNNYIVKFVNSLPNQINPNLNYVIKDEIVIKPIDYNPASVFPTYTTLYDDNGYELITSGYVRDDDITTTAYNKNSLLDIANANLINEGDIIWLGFLENGGWDVYRYALKSAKITGVYVSAPAESITFVTNKHHSLQIGDIVSVVNFDRQVNGIHIVTGLPTLNQFTVASNLSTIIDNDLVSYGLLYKFESTRFANFDQLSSKKDLFDYKEEDKIWIDQDLSNKWAVYEKTNNFTTGTFIQTINDNYAQLFGEDVYSSDDTSTVIISAPGWKLPTTQSFGKIFVYRKSTSGLIKQFEYVLNDNLIYCNTTTITDFGNSVVFDKNKDLFIIGAPSASDVVASTSTNTVVLSTGSGSNKSFNNEGIVKISTRNTNSNAENVRAILVSPFAATTATAENARFGHAIYINDVAQASTTTMLVSAPGTGTGRVFAYEFTSTTSSIFLNIHSNGIEIVSTSSVSLTTGSNWGSSIVGTKSGNLIAISAPNHIASSATGIVQIFDNNHDWLQTITPPYATGEIFAYDLAMSTTGTFLFISSRDVRSSNASYGRVFVYNLDGGIESITVDTDHVSTQTVDVVISSPDHPQGRNATAKAIKTGNKVTSIEIVDAGSGYFYPPNVSFTGSGVIVSGTLSATLKDLYQLHQILDNPIFANDIKFGESISISDDNSTLAISALGTNRTKYNYFDVVEDTETTFDNNSTKFISAIVDAGTVFVYENLGNNFILSEELNTADILPGSKYGYNVVANNNSIFVGAPANGSGAIAAVETSTYFTTASAATLTIDFSAPELDNGVKPVVQINYRSLGATKTISSIDVLYSGNGYVNTPSAVIKDSFGNVVDNLVISMLDEKARLYQFDKIDDSFVGWKKVRTQEDVIDINKIKRIALIDNLNEEIIDYLDIIDPVKGKVAGLADQEIKYKSTFDPAIYSFAISPFTVDNQNSWLDEHVGELWWDLSNAKYKDYEQGEEVYRKNTWGQLFPGASIDVYEWVRSTLLPSEWAAQADTNEGLSRGISGQPKFADNSVLSVKQVLNTITNSFENVYYYWVKNKVTVPDNYNRSISSFEVARLIADPEAMGYKFAQILSKDAISLVNIKDNIVGQRINLNIALDNIDNQNPRHTEWLLLQENNAKSTPNALLEKKLFDSLLGRDSLGSPVPDPSLAERNRYGLSIRPQQTLFKDRLAALRNLIEFSNDVLLENRITGEFDLTRLQSKEEIPNVADGLYDGIVDDLVELDFISTIGFRQAKAIANVANGKLISITITDPGFGYKNAPNVIIKYSIENEAEIKLTIDEQGKVNGYSIENAGQRFQSAPELIIRPQTYIVRANEDYNGRWTLHEYNYNLNEWSRVRTQSYNTELYWSYVDWISGNYNDSKNIDYTIAGTYGLDSLEDIQPGDYVKIRNIGDSRFVILERLSPNEIGDFSPGYNIVYSERGTIQFSNDIWDIANSVYGYDVITLEETLFDQVPDVELANILDSLRYDIFIKNLKIYWNKFFFVAVKYALSEQKLLDWAFKTSLISVINNAGSLDQIPVYKFYKAENYESYLREVKPFHSQLKEFTSQHTSLDTFNGNITDFDLPVYYNTVSNAFETVDLSDTIIDTTPYKEWKDNYLFGVERISIDDGGAGYTEIPVITITTATGDSGYGLDVEVYLNSGEISSIEVIKPGTNYLLPPIITISGGGSVTRTARASAILGLNPVRKNKVHMKFDRYSRSNEIGEKSYTDEFICSGTTNKFELTWYTDTDKITITPTLDGALIFSDDYEIVQSIKIENGHSKKISTFVFLNQVPINGQKFKIIYDKNVEIYNAIDRIDRFYNPQEGMLGDSYPQLMKGMEYPGTNILGLEFNYLLPWTTTTNSLYGTASYGEQIENYTAKKLTQTATLFTSTLYLNNVEDIIVGQTINILNSTTNRIRTDTIVESINTNSVVITTPQYFIKSIKSTGLSTGTDITVKTKTAFNGQLRVDDIIKLSDISTSEFNGNYSIVNILNNTSFIITASTILTTTTAVVNSLSKLAVSTLLEEIPVADQFLDSWIREVENTSTYTLDTYLDINLIKGSEVLVNGVPAYDVIAIDPYYEIVENPSINDRAQIKVYQLATTITNTLTFTVYTDPTVEFYTYNQNYSAVDTDLVGGQFSTGTLYGALGINPEEIIIDGDKFLSENASYAPEEMVPGQIVDSLGINVYTKENVGNPLIITGSFPVLSTSDTNTGTLAVDIANFSGILLHYNNTIFERVTSTSFTTASQFFVAGNQIVIPPQRVVGRAGYTLIKIGSDDLVDGNQIYVNATSTMITSLSSIDDISSAYVLVNGKSIYEATSGTQIRYELTGVGDYSNRASVKVYNMENRPNTVQAWFFRATYPEFNRINEEVFVVGGTAQSSFVIANPPAQLEPSSAHAIVEIYDTDDPESIKRILPPWVSYYEVQSGVNVFDIDNKNARPPGTYSISTVHVYLNGKKLRPSFDYTVNSSNSTVSINSLLLTTGDAVAVMGLVDYEYYITNNVLTLASPIQDKTLKITTFTDHDDLLIRTERFTANIDKKFTISRPVLDVNYVWVSVNGIPLTSRYDYELMPDFKTIQISDWKTVNIGDDVIITSFGSPEFVTNVVGYRFFKDIFDRTHYRRLTKYNTAELTRPLTANDIEIYVNDSTKLLSPNPSRNKPGVIIIDAERIEFFKKSGNVLKELRRSTLGTGPALISEIGTKVIDQSSLQTVPYADIVLTQNILTTSTNTYTINTVTNITYGDGIVFDNTVPAIDQVSVYYGGRLLRKTSLQVHDASISYYTSTNSLSILPPEFTINTNNEILLNISSGVSPNTKITIVQRKGMIWTGTESLLTSPVIQAVFLRDKQAELPDDYYYGGDPVLIDANFISITDEDGDPLEGY